MADYNLGTARGRIELDYDGKGVDQAGRALDGFEGKTKKAGVTSDQVSRGMSGAGAVIAAGLGVAVNAAANFEQGLSNIKAVSGATTAEMEEIRKKALQIGKDTSFGATDATKAMEELAKAGLSTDEILGGAADATVALAAAGEVELPFAAEIASNALNQFGLSAQQLPGVADQIAGAANASAISVGEFGQSLSQVGAVANLAGLSFDDTAVAIAQLGNAGIKGSDAGTSLKTMLSNLQPTTEKAKTALEEMGIITEDGTNKFYDQTGKLKSLRDIQALLNDGTKNYTAAQKQAALQTIFGSDAIRAAAVLADNGAKGYDELSTAIGKVSAADVAATKMDNLKGQVEGLKGSAETLAIGLGTVLIPILRDIVTVLTSAVNWFNNLSPGMQQAVVYTAAAAAGFLLLGAGIIKIVGYAQRLTAAVKVIAALKYVAPVLSALRVGFLAAATAVRAFTVALLTNPIGLIIVAIIALVAVIVILWKNSETFRNIVKGAWEAIKTAVSAVVSWFTGTALPAIQGVWNGIVSGAQSLWSSIVSIWNAIFSVVKTAVMLIFNIVTFQIRALLAIWNAIWGVFGGVIKAVWTLIGLIIKLALVAIVVAVTQYINLVLKVWRTVWNVVKAVVTAVWNFIKPFVTAAISAVVNAIKTYMNIVRTVWTTIWNVIKSVITTTWNIIKSVVSGAANAVRSVVTSVMNTIRSVISSVNNAILSVFRSVWNSGVVSAVRSGVAAVMGIVNSIRGKVVGAVSGAGSWLRDAGRRIIQGLLDGINAMIGRVRGALNSLTGMIPDWKGPASRDKVLLEQNGELIMQSLINGLANRVGPLRDMLGGVTADIPGSFVTPEAASGSLPRQRVSDATAEAAIGSPSVEFNVYNPVAEPTSVTTTKTMTRAAQLGVLG